MYGLLIFFFSISAFYILAKYKKHKHKIIEQSGEIIVSSKNSINIKLYKKPIDIVVAFKDNQNNVPCNPINYDSLNWRLVCYNHEYSLIIEWDVSNTREITWLTKFKS